MHVCVCLCMCLYFFKSISFFPMVEVWWNSMIKFVQVHLQPCPATFASHHGRGHLWSRWHRAGGTTLRGTDQEAAPVVAQAAPWMRSPWGLGNWCPIFTPGWNALEPWGILRIYGR